MLLKEFGTCPFDNLNFLKSRIGSFSPSFKKVQEQLGSLLPKMVYEEGSFNTICDTLAVKVFTQTEQLGPMVADTVSRLYQVVTQKQELFARAQVKILLSDRELPLKFSGKFYSFQEEGYLVEVGLLKDSNNIAIHFHRA